MAYTNLKQEIDNYVYENHENEILGKNLQKVLKDMVDVLGDGYKFMGVARTNTTIPTPEEQVFYLVGNGEYGNFGSTKTVPLGYIGVMYYDTQWNMSLINLNLNALNLCYYEGGSSVFSNRGLARQSVPTDLRHKGLIISYVANGIQYCDLCINSASATWGDDASWYQIYPFNSVSVSQNILTGKEELKIGDDVKWILDNVPEVGSDNLVKSGGVKLYSDTKDSERAIVVNSSFDVTSGQAVSSDVLYYIRIDSDFNVILTSSVVGYYNLYGTKEDGTRVTIRQNCHTNEVYQITNNNNFVAISFYISGGDISSDGVVEVKIWGPDYLNLTNSIKDNTDELRKDVNIGIHYTKTEIQLSQGTGISANDTKSIINLGKYFAYRVKSYNTNYYNLFGWKSDGTLVNLGGKNTNKKYYYDNTQDVVVVGVSISGGDITSNGTAVIEIFGEEELQIDLYDKLNQNIANQLKRKPRRGNVEQANVLNIAFFTDVHYDIENIKKYLDFTSTQGVDLMLFGGDLVEDYWSESFDSLDEFASLRRANQILLTVGNHDAWEDSYNNMASKTDVYQKMFKPFVSNWGVIQPDDAEENGLMYYYKDISNCGIRLIVLDCMYYDAQEQSWFESVLADAISNSLSVIICSHYQAQAITQFKAKGFASLETVQSDKMNYDDYAPVKAVNTFVKNGGKFICWLSGHTHLDNIGLLNNKYQEDDPPLVGFVCACASHQSGQVAYCDSARISNTLSQQAFDLLTIDTYSKKIRVARIGDNLDCYMRVRNFMTIDYEECNLLDCD